MRIAKLFSSGIFVFITAIATGVTANGAGEMMVLQESKPLVARAGAWQTWNDRLHLKSGMERRKLLLIFQNGADGRKQMTGVHIQLNRQPFATLQDFSNHVTFTRDISSLVKNGDVPITVQGYGPSGARLGWKLMTEKVIVNGVTPSPFKPGDRITISGRNFSDYPNDIFVTIDGKNANLISARNDVIQLTSPANLGGGQHDLVVMANSVKSAPFKVEVKGSAEVDWIDHLFTAPRHPIVIHGKGFSKVPSENVVTFTNERGSPKGHVTRATDKQITCIVPDMMFPTTVTIRVTVRGVQAKGHAGLAIDQRVIPTHETLLNPVH
jgi:IPT/TIG domain